MKNIIQNIVRRFNRIITARRLRMPVGNTGKMPSYVLGGEAMPFISMEG